MSSFSSVIRKPGTKVAPKAAPRRNIVRKATQTLPIPDVTPVVESGKTASTAPSEPTQNPQGANDQQPGASAATEEDSQTEPARDSAGRDDVTEVQNATRTQSSVDTVEAVPAPTRNVPEVAPSLPSNWPTQKERPASNSVTPKPRSASRSARPAAAEASRPATSGSDEHAESGRAHQGGSTTSQNATSPETPRPRSRRKQPPRGSAKVILAQPAIVTPPTTQPSRSPTQERLPSAVSQRAQSVLSQRSQAEEALDRVSASLRRVGDIAAEIVRSTPAPGFQIPAAEDNAEQTTSRDRPRKRRKKNNAEPQSIQDQAAEIVANAIGYSDLAPHRRRKATPENAEEHEIEEESTMLFDLCDTKHKYGKKSEVEKQMEANWPEILKRRKEDAAERLTRNLEGRRKKDRMQLPEQSGDGNMGEVPELVIQDGHIVVASREIDRQAATTTAANAVLEEDVREDTDIYKRVNSSTVGPSRSQIAPGQHWDDLSTEQFYQGLKMFGTDFKMISNMIPGKNRRQVKLKYNAEERLNWAKIQRCLAQKEEVNLETYATMTGLEFGSVSDVYKQMEEDEKKLREEDEQRRREEGIISQQPEHGEGEADVPLPSIEGQDHDRDGETTAADASVQPAASDRQSTAAASHVGSTTTGRHTAQPQTKKKPQVRKSTATAKRGRQANAKSKGFEGVEERLGDVAEIGIPSA